MTILQRAAAIAAMTFTFAVLGTSSQGSAHQLAARDLVAAGSSQSQDTGRPMPAVSIEFPNTPTVAAVPAPDAATDTAAPTEPFDTLADAVAAHDGDETSEAVRCLAGAIYFEAKGEPLAGQLAVAQVILNRAGSGRFPADACGVVLQRGQFGFVRAGRIPAIDATRAAYRTALAVARVAIARAWDAPAPAALYFNTPGNRIGGRLVKIAAIGNHVFYR